VDLLDGVNKVVSITCGVAEAEDSDRLVLQIERFDFVEKPVPVGSTALRSSASVPRWGANDESVVCFEARNTRLAYFLYFGGLARLFLRTFFGVRSVWKNRRQRDGRVEENDPSQTSFERTMRSLTHSAAASVLPVVDA
jgi:hypothetical protein